VHEAGGYELSIATGGHRNAADALSCCGGGRPYAGCPVEGRGRNLRTPASGVWLLILADIFLREITRSGLSRCGILPPADPLLHDWSDIGSSGWRHLLRRHIKKKNS